MSFRSRRIFGLMGLFLGIASAPESFAGNATWTGNTDGLWATTTNWSPNTVPNATTDVATFNSGSTNTTVSIGSTLTTVSQVLFDTSNVAAYTFTGTGFTNFNISAGGSVSIASSVTTSQDLSGIPIIRPTVGSGNGASSSTITFSNQGSELLKLGTFQAGNPGGSTIQNAVLRFAPASASSGIEIISGKLINNAGTANSKKISVLVDDDGTLKIAAIGTYDGTDPAGNSVSIRRGTLLAGVIGNAGVSTSLGSGGRIQFGETGQSRTATLDYYNTANATTDRGFDIVSGNTARFVVSGSVATNLTLTTGITQSGSASGGGNLVKDGPGLLSLNGTNTYTGTTTISGGALAVNGSLASSSLVVNGRLGGSGVLANATLSGTGSIDPGNSPGVLTAADTDPTGGLDYNFEFTAANTLPAWSSSDASINDVLRLTDATPFTGNLTAGNVIGLYFDVATLNPGDVFTGGFYTDTNADFLSAIAGATYQYFLADVSGNVTYNGKTYSAYTGPNTISAATVAEPADFGSGNVNGYVTQFMVVPEPASIVLLAAGVAMVGFRFARRQND